jgi:hypothetical protein
MEYELELKLPGDFEPLERGERFDLPLCDLFDVIGGDIVGSGTLVRDGSIVESVIQVTVPDLDEALPHIIKILRQGNAPSGTTVSLLLPERKQLCVLPHDEA